MATLSTMEQLSFAVPNFAVGAGAGAIIGGMLAVWRERARAAIGAGGAIAATEGKEVTLPAGSTIRIRMDTPVDIT